MSQHRPGEDGIPDAPAAKSKAESVRLTLTDLMAAFVPGFAWCLLLAAAPHVREADPLGSALRALRLPPENWLQLTPTVFAAFMVGYAVKPLVMRLAGVLSFETYFIRKEALRLHAPDWTDRDLGFPYPAIFRAGSYYDTICRRLQTHLGITSDVHGLPRYPPFSACKRLVRVLRPELWEELEHREAETRMLGSLFVAAVADACLSVIALLRAAPPPRYFGWVAAALFTSALLSVGFRTSRRREIEYVYLAYLIASANAAPSGAADAPVPELPTNPRAQSQALSAGAPAGAPQNREHRR